MLNYLTSLFNWMLDIRMTDEQQAIIVDPHRKAKVNVKVVVEWSYF